jgi:hypothetical protein
MKAAIWTSRAPNAKVVRIVEMKSRRGLEKETDAILREMRQFNGYPYAIAKLCGDGQQNGDTIAK